VTRAGSHPRNPVLVPRDIQPFYVYTTICIYDNMSYAQMLRCSDVTRENVPPFSLSGAQGQDKHTKVLLFRRFTTQIPVLPCPGSTSNASSERCAMKPFSASGFRSSGAWEAAQLRYAAPPMTPSHVLSVLCCVCVCVCIGAYVDF